MLQLFKPRFHNFSHQLAYYSMFLASFILLTGFVAYAVVDYMRLTHTLRGQMAQTKELFKSVKDPAAAQTRIKEIDRYLEKSSYLESLYFLIDGKVVAQYHQSTLNFDKNQDILLKEQSDSAWHIKKVCPWRGVEKGNVIVISNWYNILMKSSTYLLLALASMLPILGIVFLLSHRLSKSLTVPIDALISTSVKVTASQDYSLRAPRYHDDQIGLLADTFNIMLSQTQKLERAFATENETAKLAAQNTRILLKNAELAKQELTREAESRRQTEDMLSKISAHLQDIINSMPSVLVVVDEHNQITEWNESAEQLTQVNRDNALGQSLFEVMDFLVPYRSDLLQTVANNTLFVKESVPIEINQVCHVISCLIYPLNSQGQTIGAVVRIENVTCTSGTTTQYTA